MVHDNQINYEEILLSDSLYTEYEIHNWTFEQIMSLLYFSERSHSTNKLKTIDSYCPICEKETTFISKETDSQEFVDVSTAAGYFTSGDGTIDKLVTELQKIGTLQRTFSCPRPESDENHDFIVLFRIRNSKLIKIGQSPSIADLTLSHIKKYRILKNNIYTELNRAIGLSSHGIGVGSFVYLRRIIEKYLVYPALNKKIENGEINIADIANIDFKSKVERVKELLPDFLVKNKKIHGILSKGIHELEEQECKDYFNILRTSIEIILDEEIERIEKEKKTKQVEKELNNIK